MKCSNMYNVSILYWYANGVDAMLDAIGLNSNVHEVLRSFHSVGPLNDGHDQGCLEANDREATLLWFR